MGRPAQPAELAPACVFLASQESSYLNDETLGVTGGTPCPRATGLCKKAGVLKYREDDIPENVDVFEKISGFGETNRDKLGG
jgi:hypothetical protein